MGIDELLENVSVIGAAGKMGSGISVLIAQEMARLKINNPNKIYRINLIDMNEQGIEGLRKFIKTQVIKSAERGIVGLRAMFESREDLVENCEIIDAFVNETLGVVRFGTELELARKSKVVVEAVIEDEGLKIKLLKSLNELCGPDTLFFTNTSSIPIGFIDKEAGLAGRIIGYHFYNPPLVQRLVELIPSNTTRQELKDFSYALGKRLGKKLVLANDVAGFIGNGHFIRDGLHAISEVEKLSSKYDWFGGIYIMNRISQDFLIRPMGIFQLIDYVGIDVFQCILRVMSSHLADPMLHSELIDEFIEKNIIGGQYADGSQRDGFLKYENNRPVGIYDIEKGEYIGLNLDWKAKIDTEVGDPPAGFSPWKKLVREPRKTDMLSIYFNNLRTAKGLGAELARSYLARSKEIAEKLVQDGIANSSDDVNTVLTNGFFWLYGPINEYI